MVVIHEAYFPADSPKNCQSHTALYVCGSYRLRTNAPEGSDANEKLYTNRPAIAWPLCCSDNIRFFRVNEAYSESDTASHKTTGLSGDKTSVLPNPGIPRSVANTHYPLPYERSPASDHTQCTDWEWHRNLIGCFPGRTLADCGN